MADGIITLPSSAGKLDTSEVTVGANTVERQRIVIADDTGAGLFATVKAASTAAVATDEALVVAISPNNTVVTTWTPPTGASAQQIQGTSPDNTTLAGNPVWIGGDDGAGNCRSILTDAAGYLVTKNFGKEVARTPVIIYCDDITGSASEAALSCNNNKAGTVTATQTSYTVTTGKTLRIQSFTAYVTGTTTTAAGAKLRIRQAASSVSATSPVIATLGVGMPAAVATASNGNVIVFPEGLEVASTQQICLSQLATSTSSKVSACLVGFEY